MSSRKDDPVFNVKFVQLVESKPCLWNSTLPEYSKKDEIQKAWQEVANETKDTVRNCRERWRTIRSSFLRSLKLSRTSTGRGKRKYYLSKYLQFLIPYTKTRIKNSASIIAQRKVAASGNIPPMTRITNMPIVSSDDTKDSSNSADVAAIAEADVVVSLHEGGAGGGGVLAGGISLAPHAPLPLPQPLNLQAIKQEKDVISGIPVTIIPNCSSTLTLDQQQRRFLNNPPLSGCMTNTNLSSSNITTNTSITNNTHMNNNNHCIPAINAINSSNNISNMSNNNNNGNNNDNTSTNPPPPLSGPFNHPTDGRSAAANVVDLKEFAEWIKSKNELQRHCLMTTSPDADQSFLNSLHPFLKEMSGKQNRRFRQKVVALIDAVLDNAD